jgi:hypothetical protein
MIYVKAIMKEVIPDGYELIHGEYVRKITALSSNDIENYVERDAIRFFSGIGYEIKRVPKAKTRTVDYEYGDLGIEITVLHDYLPRTHEMDVLLKRHTDTNLRICAYMYLKNERLVIEILNEEQIAGNVSLLCLRQHKSCYKAKILGKITDKWIQDQDSQHKGSIIVIDFRLAHFDSLSLKREIRGILDRHGSEFPTLEGILISVPKHLDSEMFESPDYVFVNNERCVIQHKILKILNNFSLATTSTWNTFNHTFIRYSGLSSIQNPCMDCPDKAILSKQESTTKPVIPLSWK